MNTTATAELETPEIAGEKVIHLPQGIMGFEEFKEYALFDNPNEFPFVWLRAVAQPALAFLLVAPDYFIDDYCPDVSVQDTQSIGLRNPTDAVIYNIVTLHPDGSATANLKGPIVLNRFNLQGKQVVPDNVTEFPLRHPLPVAANS